MAGQWLKARIAVTNPDDAPLSGFVLGLTVGYSGKAPKKGEVELERRSQDGSWQPLPQPLDYAVNHFELEVPTIEKSGSATVELRLRLAARLIYQDGKNGFVYPHVAKPDPNREADEYPFFYFWPSPATEKKPDTGKPDTGKPDTKPETPKPEISKPSTAKPDSKPAAGREKTPGGSTGKPVTATQPTAAHTGSELADTGAGSHLPWVAGGSAIALAAGAGLFVATRRRTGQH
ncbi:LAETG motif-containing sortase-dependent surface protein [Streptomyces sp. CBMA152]|uniref:LAETG motif-containing sortase-dependent surface protein n=1 Tax=Streptomyces sp. CBMA152 TaxID=1896312 RepID=UPI00166153AD|nr:LAETG motif-containing sortase-dependent surface protein [Streptomyces sp. CBMA152]MBD0745646.1 hypothetical protein [Streptomyces sp. CBMA152]